MMMINYCARLIILAFFICSVPSLLLSQNDTNQDSKGTLCVPEYSSGCGFGDGFTDFAVAEIQNNNSACADNMGYPGWSQYLELGPAMLLGGNTYDFEMQTGYDDQFVSVWIDFNDDLLLTADEMIMTDFNMESSGTMYTVPVTIPANTAEGLHIMRARTNWQSSCDDPCNEYGYGEAEDYMVFIGESAFGSLEGTVTLLDGGDPVEGAEITLEGPYTFTGFSQSDGTYQIEGALVGEYDVTCFKEGYNIAIGTVIIVEGIIETLDFQLTQPAISVEPLSVSKVLAPGSTGEETLYIENPGNGELTWSASIIITSKAELKNPKDYLDLQFQYPAESSGGEAGIESDGSFIYTTQWNGNAFYKYDLDGNFVEQFTIPDTYFIRDLAYDGTYFYGGTGQAEVFEMDFENMELVSTFIAPTDVRGIAYNDAEDIFYANNWSSPVVLFDRSGNELGSFNVGPAASDYYGLAFDNISIGGPFLWGYGKVGAADNQLIQMQLPSGIETGFVLDIEEVLTGSFWGDAGGLFTHAHIVSGKVTLGGMVQGDWIWGLELGEAATWLSVNPIGGTIAGGEEAEATIIFDATELEIGEYEAEIHINTWPFVGSPVVNVTLSVGDVIPEPPTNLNGTVDCDIFELCWEVMAADSCSIYNYDTLVATTEENCYTLSGPGDYETSVTAWLAGKESEPSEILAFEIPIPEDLEPVNFSIDDVNGSIISLSWDVPIGCATADGYNIYRDGMKINTEMITELAYADTMDVGGTYEYYATAVYYFGESGPSNSEFVVVTTIDGVFTQNFAVMPNPFKDVIEIYFALPNPDQAIIILYNQMGQIQKTYTRECRRAGRQSIKFNTADLSAGVYFCEFKTSNENKVVKIIKPE